MSGVRSEIDRIRQERDGLRAEFDRLRAENERLLRVADAAVHLLANMADSMDEFDPDSFALEDAVAAWKAPRTENEGRASRRYAPGGIIHTGNANGTVWDLWDL